MINISTKKMTKGKYVCYATIDGYDHSFDGDNVQESQDKMRGLIDKKFQEGKIGGGVKWEQPQIIKLPVMKEKTNNINKIGYKKSRIDNNPIA